MDPDASVSVFAYGSLILPEVWQAVTGKLHRSEPGHIRGFIRRTVRGATYPGIIAGDDDARVDGQIYHDVETDALAALDAFESDFYVRRTIEAENRSLARVCCQAYLIPPHHAHLLSDSEWQLERFAAEHLDVFLARHFE